MHFLSGMYFNAFLKSIFGCIKYTYTPQEDETSQNCRPRSLEKAHCCKGLHE